MPALTKVFLTKAAADAGFDITPQEHGRGGWILCCSSRFSMQAWLRPHERGGVLALSAADVLENLRNDPLAHPYAQEEGEDMPESAAGALLATERQDFYDLIRRATRMELSLPHRLARAFDEETRQLPRATEAECTIIARIGQNKLREALLDYWHGCCAVTGLAVPALLRASHIKPWRDCDDDRERLNLYNALLLAPHLDALFDGGWISFDDHGKIMISPNLSASDVHKLGVNDTMKVDAQHLHREHLVFLQYHRENLFLASR